MTTITWTPGIGDPTIFGWLTVLAYGLAAWMCLRAFLAEKAGPPRPLGASIQAWGRVTRKHFPKLPPIALRAGFWLAMAGFLIAMGVNKQLDLQTLFTQVARLVVSAMGLYEVRRILQLGFLILLAVLIVRTVRVSRRLLSGHRELSLAFWGFVWQTAFILARATSFHGIDHSLGETLFGIPLNFLFEMTGIALLMAGAASRITARRRKSASSEAS